MICKRCGKEVARRAKICAYCGESVKGTDEFKIFDDDSLLDEILDSESDEHRIGGGDNLKMGRGVMPGSDNKSAGDNQNEKKSSKWIWISLVAILIIGAAAVAYMFLIMPNGEKEVKADNAIIDVEAGADYTLILRKDGTVDAIGNNAKGQCNVEEWSDITAVAAGDEHTVGLRKDGTVVAVGNNEYGQCNVNSWNNIIKISASGQHTVGLKDDGTVVAVGWNESGRCNVEDWSGISDISAGPCFTVGLKKDGTVVAVGSNEYGQCDVQSWNKIDYIRAETWGVIGFSKGQVYLTGFNSYNLGDDFLSELTDLISGENFVMGIRKDGTAVLTTTGSDDSYDVSFWENIKHADAGHLHAVAITKDGEVIATGDNKYGQCDVERWN